MTEPSSRLRVLVCGTTFGRIYLRGLAFLPEMFELAGILARGSLHSAEVARAHGVPLYTDVAQVPKADIDVACVVVRSAVVGGAGADLALALLERGIHVLQEHPVHHDELAACLQMARRSGCLYRLNSFYPDVGPVARFIQMARRVLAVRRAMYVDAACSVHVLYPLVDILGQTLGGLRPWSFLAPADQGDGVPFIALNGTLAGVPLTLRVQNEMDLRDPDNHTHVLHRIVLGTDGGTLTLTDTHGLVLWSPRMHVERNGEGVLDMFSPEGNMALPATSVVGPLESPSFNAVFTDLWPGSIARSLARFHAAVQAGNDDARLSQYHLTACRVWQELGKRLGPVRVISPPMPRPLALSAVGGEGLGCTA